MSSRVPPHSLDAEAAVLGAILLRPEVFHWLDLRVDEFYLPAHRAVYEAMVNLIAVENQPVDVVTLELELQRMGALKRVPGEAAFLAELAARVPTAENVGHYAHAVRRLAALRRLIETAAAATERAFAADAAQAEEVIETAMRDLMAAGNLRRARIVTPAEGAASAGARHRNPPKDDTPIKTGLTDLDQVLGGLRKRRLVIIGGRPGSGKSTLAQVIADHVTARGVSVGWFSLEEEHGDLYDAMIGRTAGLDSERVSNNEFTEHELRRWDVAEAEWHKRPLFICDKRNLTLREIAQHAREMKTRHDIQVLVLDYLGLVARPFKRAEHEELAQIIREFNALAQEINVAPILVAQINRDFERLKEQQVGKSHRPKIHHLQGAGAIEQCAWRVLLMYRACMDDPKADGNICEIIVGKNKRGRVGKVDARWVAHLPSIEDLPFDYVPQRAAAASKPPGGSNGGGGNGHGRGQQHMPYPEDAE